MKYSITYETWDEDSIEVGETDDKGFEVQDEEIDMDGIIGVIEEFAFYQNNNSHGFSLSTMDGDIDYRTGETTYRTIHIECTDQEKEEILYHVKTVMG